MVQSTFTATFYTPVGTQVQPFCVFFEVLPDGRTFNDAIKETVETFLKERAPQNTTNIHYSRILSEII